MRGGNNWETLIAVILMSAIAEGDSDFLSSPAYPHYAELVGLDLHFLNSLTINEAIAMLRQIRLGLAGDE